MGIKGGLWLRAGSLIRAGGPIRVDVPIVVRHPFGSTVARLYMLVMFSSHRSFNPSTFADHLTRQLHTRHDGSSGGFQPTSANTSRQLAPKPGSNTQLQRKRRRLSPVQPVPNRPQSLDHHGNSVSTPSTDRQIRTSPTENHGPAMSVSRSCAMQSRESKATEPVAASEETWLEGEQSAPRDLGVISQRQWPVLDSTERSISDILHGSAEPEAQPPASRPPEITAAETAESPHDKPHLSGGAKNHKRLWPVCSIGMGTVDGDNRNASDPQRWHTPGSSSPGSAGFTGIPKPGASTSPCTIQTGTQNSSARGNPTRGSKTASNCPTGNRHKGPSRRPRKSGQSLTSISKTQYHTRKPARSGGSQCYYCGKGLLYMAARYRCCHCTIELCHSCSPNASLIHPGHRFLSRDNMSPDELQGDARQDPSMDIGPSPDRQGDERDTEAGTGKESDGRHETDAGADMGADSDPDDTKSAETPKLYQYACYYCHKELAHLRYECQDCSDIVSSCLSCRAHHDPRHVFLAIGQPVRSRQPRTDGHSDASHASQDGHDGDLYEAVADPDEDVLLGGFDADDPDKVGDGEEDADSVDGESGESGDEGSSSNVEESDARVRGAVVRRQQQHPSTSSLVSYNPTQDTVSISRESFTRLSGFVRSLLDVAEQKITTQARPRPTARAGNASAAQAAMDLLDFDIGDARVDGDEEESSVLMSPPSLVTTSALGRSPRRPWLPEDKRQLVAMKQKGWTNVRIAKALGRSQGAVSQQWRKQVEG